jgi:hypothetical protein
MDMRNGIYKNKFTDKIFRGLEVRGRVTLCVAIKFNKIRAP